MRCRGARMRFPFSATAFHELASGRRRGLRAAIWRGGLRLAEALYARAIAWRNRRYDRGQATIHRLEIPVISVGNITAGGTGKTPLVAWLARWFQDAGLRVAIISRGYAASAGARNDEAMELEQQLPGVPHLQDPDRVAAARAAIRECDCQLILLDDAFQHRRIHRDLDIVLLDALEPFGYGHLLPRGLLRESPAGLARAHVVALSRADLIDGGARDGIWNAVRQLAPSAVRVAIAHRPQGLLQWPGERRPIERLHGHPVAAFCGIGNPEGFRRTLARSGLQVVAFRPFADHHPYTRQDLVTISKWAAETSAKAIVCTHKDLVKVRCERLGELALYAILIGVEILDGGGELAGCLRRCTAGRLRPGGSPG